MTFRSARTIASHQQSPPRCRDEAEPLVLDQPERLPAVPDSVSCCAISYSTRATRTVGYLRWLVVAVKLPNAESEHSQASPACNQPLSLCRCTAL